MDAYSDSEMERTLRYITIKSFSIVTDHLDYDRLTFWMTQFTNLHTINFRCARKLTVANLLQFLQAIKSLPLKNLILKNWIVHFRNEESPKAVEAAKVVGNQLYQFDLETLLLHQSVVEFLGLDNESGVKYLPPTLTVSNLPVSEGLLLDLPPELKYLKVMIDYHDYHDYLAVLR
jgi:hypothetical protein